ncbi:MAG TPA: hypothetical protein VGS07_17480 [Thermoanaerobaculia bacterium]|jgi:hypothetical protein|nr:hypothetical protein [Thermoanaerobaculia bacterium]
MQSKQIGPIRTRRLARLGAWSLAAIVALSLGVAPAFAQTSEAGWMIVTGKWSKGAVDTPAWFDLASWHLVTKFNGPSPRAILDPEPSPWYPVAGDFNGDGIDEVMMFNRDTWDVVAAAQGPVAVTSDPQPQPWVPVAGNWDGRGIATLRVFDLRDGSLHNLSERLGIVRYDPEPSPWRPQVGNFDGRGQDIVATWRLNEKDAAATEWVQVVGDWDGDRIDTLGAVSAVTGEMVVVNNLALKAATFTPLNGSSSSRSKPTPISPDLVVNGSCYTTTKNYGETTHVVKVGSVCTSIVLSTWEDWSCCALTAGSAGPYSCSKQPRIKSKSTSSAC